MKALRWLRDRVELGVLVVFMVVCCILQYVAGEKQAPDDYSGS